MKLLQEFKEFAVKGNVIDLAVGVIIGAAFGKIVSSLVEDVVMPPIGYAIRGVDFSKLSYALGSHDGKTVEIKYGLFINHCIHFLIVAFVIFLVVRQFNKLKRAPEPVESHVRNCPFCVESISKKATKCPHCTADVDPMVMPA